MTVDPPSAGGGEDTRAVTSPPPPGLTGPTPAYPVRRPGSVRRTTSLDLHMSPDGSVAVLGRGRDLTTAADGSVAVVATGLLRLTIDPDGRVVAASGHPSDPTPLVGRSAAVGFRTAVWRSLRADYDAGTPLHLLLDDVPGAMVISGLTSRRVRTAAPAPPRRRVDVCIGWAAASDAVARIEATGHAPPLWNPPAPELAAADRAGSHSLALLPPAGMRRARRLDVWAEGDGLVADVGFRDTFVDADGVERVLHDYRVDVVIDAAGRVVRCAVSAAVLPHLECPGATASALRVVGMPVGRLRESVSAEFFGPTTCTHLNDVLRGLTDLPTMASGTGGTGGG